MLCPAYSQRHIIRPTDSHFNRKGITIDGDGHRPFDVDGDGNCFFHAIVKSDEWINFYPTIRHGQELREDIVRQMQEHMHKKTVELFVIEHLHNKWMDGMTSSGEYSFEAFVDEVAIRDPSKRQCGLAYA